MLFMSRYRLSNSMPLGFGAELSTGMTSSPTCCGSSSMQSTMIFGYLPPRQAVAHAWRTLVGTVSVHTLRGRGRANVSGLLRQAVRTSETTICRTLEHPCWPRRSGYTQTEAPAVSDIRAKQDKYMQRPDRQTPAMQQVTGRRAAQWAPGERKQCSIRCKHEAQCLVKPCMSRAAPVGALPSLSRALRLLSGQPMGWVIHIPPHCIAHAQSM